MCSVIDVIAIESRDIERVNYESVSFLENDELEYQPFPPYLCDFSLRAAPRSRVLLARFYFNILRARFTIRILFFFFFFFMDRAKIVRASRTNG